MSEERSAQLPEAERAELERVVEASPRWPRLSGLLRYMGEKLFSGEADQLNEYNIATDVLGGSRKGFDAGGDAMAGGGIDRARKAVIGCRRGCEPAASGSPAPNRPGWFLPDRA